MPVELNTRSKDFAAQFATLLAARGDSPNDVDSVVAAIVEDVQRRGDGAVIDYTHKFDRVTLTAETMALSAAQIDDAAAVAPKDAVRALQLAAKRITAYHRKQMPAAKVWTDAAGIQLGFRWSPIASAGLYVPGGTAAYPSSVLMNALPARVAGVERLIIAVPAPDGRLNPLVMAAARRRSRHSPTARRRFRRSTRSSGRATPMSQPPSVWCSARSAST